MMAINKNYRIIFIVEIVIVCAVGKADFLNFSNSVCGRALKIT